MSSVLKMPETDDLATARIVLRDSTVSLKWLVAMTSELLLVKMMLAGLPPKDIGAELLEKRKDAEANILQNEKLLKKGGAK